MDWNPTSQDVSGPHLWLKSRKQDLLVFFSILQGLCFYFMKMPLSWPTSCFYVIFSLPHQVEERHDGASLWLSDVQPRPIYHVLKIHSYDFPIYFVPSTILLALPCCIWMVSLANFPRRCWSVIESGNFYLTADHSNIFSWKKEFLYKR